MLRADPITKINGELVQGIINQLESELAKRVAKRRNTEDLVEKGRNYGFLVVVLGKNKYGTIIGNRAVEWKTPKDSGDNETIQA